MKPGNDLGRAGLLLSSTSISLRISITASPFGKMRGARFTHSIASSSDFTLMIEKPATSSFVSVNGPSMTVHLSPLKLHARTLRGRGEPLGGEEDTGLHGLGVVPLHRDERFWLRRRPASDSFGTMPMTMKRIVLS
jgi:hypothetical protein